MKEEPEVLQYITKNVFFIVVKDNFHKYYFAANSIIVLVVGRNSLQDIVYCNGKITCSLLCLLQLAFVQKEQSEMFLRTWNVAAFNKLNPPCQT